MTIEKYTEYREKLLEIVQPFILAHVDANKGELQESIENLLFDGDGPRNTTPFSGRDAIVARKLFLDFGEVVDSYLSLRDIEIYLRRFPYNDTEISSLRYLRYHIESYLNGVYIFSERIKSYFTFLERRYRRSPLSSDVSALRQNLVSFISSSLDNVTSIRGEHVHERRYSDHDLEKLSLWNLLSTFEDSGDIFLKAYDLNYEIIKMKWEVRIESNNVAMEQILDICCQNLYSVLFTEDGQFVFPDDH